MSLLVFFAVYWVAPCFVCYKLNETRHRAWPVYAFFGWVGAFVLACMRKAPVEL